MRLVSFFLFAFVILMLLAGCASDNVQMSEVPGTYKLEYAPYGKVIASDTLVIKTNGTYTRVFTASGYQTWRSKGKWWLESTEPDTITMEPFIEHIAPNRNVRKVPEVYSGVHTRLSKHKGNIVLSYNHPDVTYRKIQ